MALWPTPSPKGELGPQMQKVPKIFEIFPALATKNEKTF